MRPFLVSVSAASLLLLQGMLLPLASRASGVAESLQLIGGDSWRALILYVVFIGVLGAWCLSGKAEQGHAVTGRRIMYFATLLGPLPLCLFFNGLLDDNIVDMTALWLIPFALLFAGAFLSREWQNFVKMIVIGISLPLMSLLFLTTFVDFGN